MKVAVSDKPKLISGQYTEVIDNYKLYYNPLGYGGVTMIDTQSQTLLNLCDGKKTINHIAKVDGRDINTILDEINSLVNSEVIFLSDEFTSELHKKNNSKKNISCWLHLTNSCNLTCSYCYVHKTPGSMSLKTGKLAIDKMLQTCRNNNIENMNIKFAGGEPLLRFDLIKKLVNYSQIMRNDIKVTYTLLTNGILITKEIAEYIKHNNIGVGVSLDGIGEVNDFCRFDKNKNGSFERVIKGLEVLKIVNVKPSIMTTVSSSNYRDLMDLTKFILDEEYFFRFSLEKDCDTGFTKLSNQNEDLIDKLHGYYDYIESRLPNDDFTKIHKFGDASFKKPAKKSCGAASNLVSIGHDGKIGVCGLGLSNPFSTLDESNDLLLQTSKYNHQLTNNIASDYDSCHTCVWRKSCAGGCPLQTKAAFGRYDKQSPYCEVYKAILPRVLRTKGLQMIRDSKID